MMRSKKVFIFLILLIGNLVNFAWAGDEPEAIAATVGQLIPKIVDEQIASVRLGAGLNNGVDAMSSFGADVIYVRNRYLVGITISKVNISSSATSPSVYGGMLFGQRRFNKHIGKYYIDLLLGAGSNQSEKLLYIAEPRIEVVLTQTRKLFLHDILTNNTFGIKLGASLRIAAENDFSNIAGNSAGMINLSLFIGKYSD